MVLGKVAGFCNNESHSALEFGIELSTVERPNSVWVIGIEQQSVEHRAQDRTVAPVGFQSLPHVIFEFAIRVLHGSVHRHAQIGFLVGREFARDILQKHKGTQLHEEFAKQQRRCPRLASDRAGRFGLGAGIVGGFYLGDGFEDAIVLNERTAPRRAPLVPVLLHPSRFEAEQSVEEIVRIATEERSGQPDDTVGT